jgi:hypothetical protein
MAHGVAHRKPGQKIRRDPGRFIPQSPHPEKSPVLWIFLPDFPLLTGSGGYFPD